MQMVWCLIATPQHRANQVAAPQLLADLNTQRRVEMTIHRIEVVHMPNDDNTPRIVCASIHNLTISYSIDVGSSGIIRNRIPILTRVPVAWIVPSIFNLSTVANKKAIAEWLTWHSNWKAK